MIKFHPELSVISWFVNPKILILLVYRGFPTIYTWIILIGRLVQYALDNSLSTYGIANNAYCFFCYFTNLCFFGLTIYFTVRFFPPFVIFSRI